MSRYAAFLRGINVGGSHRVKSPELRSVFEALGLADVQTFRASGNVIFVAPSEPPRELSARIEDGLQRSLGYEVETFLRTAEELRAITRMQPFTPAQVEASAGKIQVGMLSERPGSKARKDVLALASDDNTLAFGERELYWLPRGGMSDSALDLKLIAKALGSMTLRTKGTVEQIAERHFSD
jgi:uncharacterized protein (DUF1697 family)